VLGTDVWLLSVTQGLVCFLGHAQKQDTPEQPKTYVSEPPERKYADVICPEPETLVVTADQAYQALTGGPTGSLAACR
jgi:hypothetical protein